MYRLLLQANPIFWFLIPILVAALWFDSWMDPIAFPTEQYFYKGLKELQRVSFSFVIELLGAVLLTVTAFLLNTLNINYKLTDARGNLISVVFLLLVGSLNLPMSHPAMVAIVFVFFLLHFLLSFIHSPESSTAAFNSGLLLGVASLFYHNLLYFFPLIWLGILILAKPSIRLLVLSALGFALPYFYAFTFNYIMNDFGFQEQWKRLMDVQLYEVDGLLMDQAHWALLAFMLLTVTWASIEFFSNYYKLIIVRRKSFRLLMSFLLLSALLTLFLSSASTDLLVSACIPASFLFVRLLANFKRNWMRELMLWSLILLVLWVKLGFVLW